MKSFLYFVLATFATILSACADSAESRVADIEHQAKELVRANLKAPASAHFVESKVVGGRLDTAYVVHVVVDAENSFGAKLRSSYLVALRLDGGHVVWDQATAIQEASPTPSKQEIAQVAMLNGIK